MSDFLSWSHYVELLRFDDINKINYYIKEVENKKLGVRELRKIIKEKEYERLPKSTKEKLKKGKEVSLIETIKDPIIIKSNDIDINNIKEYELI